MYKLGFCVYGPQCRYKHTRLPAPAPPPESIEAAKPREFRDPTRSSTLSTRVRAPVLRLI